MPENKLSIWFHIFLIAFLVLHHQNEILSQHTVSGSPIIEHFSPESYKAGTQNWDIEIMDNGHLFFANNSGLLQYDGLNWQLYKLPNKTIVRSVRISPSQRVYVGGQDELGYFIPNQKGVLTFNSIREKIPQAFLPLQDIWQMLAHQNKIYIRSVNRVYVYDEADDSFEIIDPNNILDAIFEYQDNVYYSASETGIFHVFDKSRFWPIPDFMKNHTILNYIGNDNQALIITEKNGIYVHKADKAIPLNNDVHKFLIENEVFTSRILPDSTIAIGTKFGGFIIIDPQGNALKYLSTANGLTNANIQTLIKDEKGNLWSGTSNGIDKIYLSSPIEIIHPDGPVRGTFYDITNFEDCLYFGSNNALYKADLNQKQSPFYYTKYDVINNSQGQVWGLDVIHDELIMGHNNGAFNVKNNQATSLSDIPGAWKFVETGIKKDMYVGTYNGVDIYKRQGNKWKYHKKMDGFLESARILISVRKYEVWVSHPYRGVYKIIHDEDYNVQSVELYDESKGLPSILQNYIFDIDGVPIVAAEKGVFSYDRIQDKFIPSEQINEVLDPEVNVRRLFRDSKENIWFVTEDEVGYLSKTNDEPYIKTTYPTLEDYLVGGFENIFFFKNDEVLLCANNCIIKLNTSKDLTSTLPNINISSVRLTGSMDSLLYGGYGLDQSKLMFEQTELQIPELNHRQNEIVFNFNTTQHNSETTYSYAITEFNNDPEWSVWSNSTTKEYNNLLQGEYTFHVKAKSSQGVESKAKTYTFIIDPPWFYSKTAYFFYFLGVLGLLGAIIFFPNKAYRKEKQLLTTAKLETEAELEKMTNEKLQADIKFKNSELANSTFHLVQKNETINKIRQEIQNTYKLTKEAPVKKELKKIISLLSDDERLEDEWEKFSYHFDQVHTDFLKRLSKEYAQLTPKDKKLCAYLRMNLTTKEIAPLLNISVRGVEISRYRLRKKLELDGNVNLNEFMMAY